MPPFSASIVWLDANGNRTITRVSSLAGFGSFISSLIALSNADYQTFWQGVTSPNPAPAPTPAQFQSVVDRAALTFLCADLTLTVVVVPAPVRAIFQVDGETVDPGSAPMAAFIAAATGALCNASGSPTTSFVSGARLPRAANPA